MNMESNRTDVQIKTLRMVELMSRPRGASSKEVCSELNCTSRTFYRNLERLQNMGVPYYDKDDYDGATNSKRWFVPENAVVNTQFFLTAEERLFLRMILEQNRNISKNKDLTNSLLSKMNKGIFHDIDDRNYDLKIKDYAEYPSFYYDDNEPLFIDALENHKALTFTSADFFIPSEKEKGMVVIQKLKVLQKNFVFEPYTIVFQNDTINNRLCCIGCVKGDGVDTSIECIDISSIKDLKILKSTFTIPDEYDAKGWKKVFFPILKEKIHLVMDYSTLLTFMGQSWFCNQEYIKVLGQYHLFFEADPIRVKKLILSYGRHIHVVEPKELADSVKREYQGAMRYYEKGSDDAVQENKYFIKLKAENTHLNDNTCEDDISNSMWKTSLYKLIDDGQLDKSIFNFDDEKMKELMKVVHTKKSTPYTFFFYNEQIAINYNRINNMEFVPADEALYIMDNWASFVDEILTKCAPELLDRKELYIKNGPQFFYMVGEKPLSKVTYSITKEGIVPFNKSIFDDNDFLKLPGRAIFFHIELVDKENVSLTVYKWWKK